MKWPANPWLLAAGAGSLVAAAAHVACIIGGADWYRYLGAGNRLASAVERGAIFPHVITAVITGVLVVWALIAFSAAGLMARLPLLRVALVLISAVLLLRAAAVFMPSLWLPEHTSTFRAVSSALVLALGACFAVGTVAAWPSLSTRS